MRFQAMVEGHTQVLDIQPAAGGFRVQIGDRRFTVERPQTAPGLISLRVDGQVMEAGVEKAGEVYIVHLRGRVLRVELGTAMPGGGAETRRPAGGPTRVSAPMPGRVVRVMVEPGDEVAAGQGLLVMEAMKMENELRAPRAGRVAEVRARPLTAVETGALLVVLE